MGNSAIAAANHFTDLYSEEIEAGEVTADMVYEWWTQTKEQYPGVDFANVEGIVLSPNKPLVDFANEVNKDWIGGYEADIIGKYLVVYLNGKTAAQMDKKFQVVGNDEDAVEQLEYMANR